MNRIKIVLFLKVGQDFWCMRETTSLHFGTEIGWPQVLVFILYGLGISLFQLVTILLKHGANPLQPNDKGQTPVDVANDINIKKLLAREIISSNSETSSIDEVRSPTSPESLASIKDEDRGIDVEGIIMYSCGLCWPALLWYGKRQ